MSDKRGRYPNQFITQAVRLVDAGGRFQDVARTMGVPEELLIRWVAQHRLRDDGEESYWLAWITRQFAERFEFDAGKATIFVMRRSRNEWYLNHTIKGCWDHGWSETSDGEGMPLVEALKVALRETAPVEVQAQSLFSEVAHG